MSESRKSARPRRFAPLSSTRKNDPEFHDAPQLKGVVFDVDGTLCLPQNYMFSEMRAALRIPKSVDILEHISLLSTASARASAISTIQAIERRAMSSQRPQPGLVELMDYLASKSVPKALCTRNFPTPVSHLLTNFLSGHDFEPIITRDTVDIEPKPAPAGILHIAQKWAIEPITTDNLSQPQAPPQPSSSASSTRKIDLPPPPSADLAPPPEAQPPSSPPLPANTALLPLIMVGDSLDDLTAGHLAGAATVLLVNEVNAPLAKHAHTDLTIKRLDELIGVLEGGFVGRDEEEWEDVE